MTRLRIGFYDGSTTDRLRDIVTRFLTSSSFVHVCFVFYEYDGTNTVASVTNDGVQIQKNRERFKPGWKFVEVDLTPREVSQMMKYCLDAKERKAGYNSSGLKWSWTPFPSDGGEKTYMCSEFIVYAFQSIGYLTDLVPSGTTPGDLYEILKRENDITPQVSWKPAPKTPEPPKPVVKTRTMDDASIVRHFESYV